MSYLELFKGKAVSKAGSKLVIEDIPYTEAKFRKSLPRLIEDIEGSDALLVLSVKDQDKYQSVVYQLYHELFNSIIDVVIEEEVEVEVEATFNIPYKFDLELVMDSKTGDKYVVNMETNRLDADIHPTALLASYAEKAREEIEKTSMNVAHCIFNPRDPRAYYSKDGFTFLNKYCEPVWRVEDKIPTKEPKEFLLLLNHLFKGDKDQIDFVLNWIYRLLTSRNETALVLNGFKGVGKNVLYSICKALVGYEYCSEATKKFGIKEFNDILRDRILILIDEHQINKDKYNFLKASFNEYQTIEAKGKNVKSTEKIYTNYMIFHNSSSDLYLENSERRFSVMDITEKRLTDVWSQDDIAPYLKDIEDPSSATIKDIGQYILNYGKGKEQNPFSIYLGEKYKEILEEHIDVVITAMVDLIEKQEENADGEIDGGRINKHCYTLLAAKRATKASRAESLINEYRYKGIYSLGKILKHTVPWKLQVNPEVLDLVARESE